MNLEGTVTGHTGQPAPGAAPWCGQCRLPAVENRTPADSFHSSLPIPASPLSPVPAIAGAGAARPLPHAPSRRSRRPEARIPIQRNPRPQRCLRGHRRAGLWPARQGTQIMHDHLLEPYEIVWTGSGAGDPVRGGARRPMAPLRRPQPRRSQRLQDPPPRRRPLCYAPGLLLS
jgi:hypothetical protein